MTVKCTSLAPADYPTVSGVTLLNTCYSADDTRKCRDNLGENITFRGLIHQVRNDLRAINVIIPERQCSLRPHPGFLPSAIVPSTDLQARCHGSELTTRRATSGLMRRSKTSAVARLFDHLVGAGKSVGGTSRPSAFATIRLTTRSNLAGCSTGRSAGFAPRKILSIKSPGRR